MSYIDKRTYSIPIYRILFELCETLPDESPSRDQLAQLQARVDHDQQSPEYPIVALVVLIQVRQPGLYGQQTAIELRNRFGQQVNSTLKM